MAVRCRIMWKFSGLANFFPPNVCHNENPEKRIRNSWTCAQISRAQPDHFGPTISSWPRKQLNYLTSNGTDARESRLVEHVQSDAKLGRVSPAFRARFVKSTSRLLESTSSPLANRKGFGQNWPAFQKFLERKLVQVPLWARLAWRE